MMINQGHRLQSNSVKNHVSEYDMNRIPLCVLVRFLSFLIDRSPSSIPLAILAIITGFSYERIIKLEGGREYTPSDESLHIDQSNSDIKYNVFNMGKHDGGNIQIGQIALSLPSSIVSIIIKSIENSPISKTLNTLNKNARIFSRTCGGRAPTWTRLSNSFWALSSGYLSDIEKCYVRGNVPAKHRAQINYYRIDNHSINDSFCRYVTGLIKKITGDRQCSKTLFNFLSITDLKRTLPNTNLGSTIALPIYDIKSLFTLINDVFSKKHGSLILHDPEGHIDTYIELFNLQQFQLFLLQQISFGLRAVDKRLILRVCLEENLAVIEDKDSSEYIEDGIGVICDILKQQYVTVHHDTNLLYKHFESRCISIEYSQDSSEYGYAQHMYTSKSNRGVNVRRMTSKIWMHMLNEIFPSQSMPNQSNFIRHTIATHLHSKVPQELIHMYLRHKIDGIDITDPYSSFGWNELLSLKQFLDFMLKSLNPTVLGIYTKEL